MVVTVYCGSSRGADPAFAQAAHELGAWIARSGHTLAYGGSAIGLMGILAKAALERGGKVIGVEPRFFLEAGVEQHDLTELIETETMSERKMRMIELGDAFVALPGGVGTLEEITEIMSRIRLRLSAAPCILLNVNGYYDELRSFLDKMTGLGFLEPDERAAIAFPASVREAGAIIEAWNPATHRLDPPAWAR